MNTIVLPCSCKSEFQDETYGNGRRLHNVSQKKGVKPSDQKKKCTVCNNLK